jgi:hypothetical protein
MLLIVSFQASRRSGSGSRAGVNAVDSTWQLLERAGTLPTACDTDNGSRSFDALIVEPRRDRDRIEPEQVSPLDERDASFSHESADVTDADAEEHGEGFDVDEVRERRRCRGLAFHA